MNDVVVAELRFLRKVAAATNDTNTVEAIDLVLKKRQDRLNKLVTKLENEVKEERQQQAGERQQRRPAPDRRYAAAGPDPDRPLPGARTRCSAQEKPLTRSSSFRMASAARPRMVAVIIETEAWL